MANKQSKQTSNKKGITVRYTLDEYESIKQKANMYGYESLSSYIRDISLNEQVITEQIEGKEELCLQFDKLRKELIKEEQLIRDAIPDIVSTKEERYKYDGVLE